ncbi:MAG: orotidine-5'-phosphate decarboxylase [Acidobacteriales bacterium]|nr:orotidine-5'-phosphate decarboxylase [Terriglobales bacterium]
MNADRLIIALDVSSAREAQAIVQSIGDAAVFYKVGLQLFTAAGSSIVRELTATGKKVFLDLKLHDIPNTVAGAVRSMGGLNVHMLTVHASGGSKMLRAAVDAATGLPHPPTILAVTVLTSMDEDDMAETGVSSGITAHVAHLARLAKSAGCGGVVVSPLEITTARQVVGDSMAIVVPGIRPVGSGKGDQARTATPADAIRAGATHLVVGRPITAADDPPAATRSVLNEMETQSALVP